jgi:hypothetical protein
MTTATKLRGSFEYVFVQVRSAVEQAAEFKKTMATPIDGGGKSFS